MDTSKEYIKMCRAATEIQTRHTFESGDYLISGDDGKIAWILGDVEFDEQKRIKFSAHEFEHFSLTTYFCEDLIWLPRQDQLQEMLNLPINEMYDALFTFYSLNFAVRSDFWWKKVSWEQLWLAFVMKEKYNKNWNGEEWVNQV